MKAVRRTSVFAALIAIFVQLFIPASMAIAAIMTNTKVADWRNTWHLHLFNGLHWTDTGMWMKKVDGKVAFCVEHGVDLDMSGSGYNPRTYSDAKKDQLAKIAYYGYYQNPTNRNYAVTQMIIWETLGDSLLTTPNKTYQSEKKAILDKVAAHDRNELKYYVKDGTRPIERNLKFVELLDPVFKQTKSGLTVTLSVKYLDTDNDMSQVSQYTLPLSKQSNNWIITDGI